jgi:Sulfotransferase family
VVAQLDSDFVRIAPGRAAARLISYALFEGRPVTTTGQWWNPVVFGNLRLAARASRGSVDRPIFVVGMGRSGTTLLGRILAAHRSVGFLNEPKAMWNVIRDDEDIIGSYAPGHPGRLHLVAEDADENVRDRATALFSWYSRLSRSRRIVDKYPELVFRHSFVQAIFPDARFLVAVRSPWTTLKSVAHWSDVHGSEHADWWGVDDRKWDAIWTQGVVGTAENADLASLELGAESDHRVRAAVEWVVSMRAALSLARSNPQARLVVYDELVLDPRAYVREILAFCDLPTSARTEAYAESVVAPSEPGPPPTDLVLALIEALEDTWESLTAFGRAQ